MNCEHKTERVQSSAFCSQFFFFFLTVLQSDIDVYGLDAVFDCAFSGGVLITL